VITLPKTPRNRPTFRIMHMPAFAWTPTQAWAPLPIPRVFDRATGDPIPGTYREGGYHLTSISRWCLPDEDRAEFYIDTGTINGTTVTAVDLSNTVVRIQILDDEQFPNGYSSLSGAPWKTVFVGPVISIKTNKHVGNADNGRTVYHCAGILTRTRMWPLDRHSTEHATHAKGHPGYNVPLHGWFRKVLGNKAGATVASPPFTDLTSPAPDIADYYTQHKLPLDGSTANLKWTDEEVVRHALVSSRAQGEVKIETSMSQGLFAGTYSWPVSPGDSCFDLIRRVCNRQRGRGSVYIDYSDASADGDVYITLKARPCNVGQITYNTVATPGALALTRVNVINPVEIGTDPSSTAINVDLNGDHRITDAGFSYENRYSSLYDIIVAQGECIQVLCNLNFFGSSLSKRWSDADETAFAAIAVDQIRQRTSGRWRHVWRRYGIDPDYNFSVKAIPGAVAYSINMRCSSTGTLETASGEPGLTSEMTYRILPDLPIYEGWNYAVQPAVRYDSSTDYLPPSRMPAIVMYQADTNISGEPTYVPLDKAGFNIQSDDFGMLIVNSNEEATGYRYLATSALPGNQGHTFAGDYNIPDVTLTSGLDQNKINTVVGVELGTRVSLTRTGTFGIYETAGRRMTMTVNGVHLWVGAPAAIWELDYVRAATGSQKWNAGLRLPTDTVDKYIIRDDRNELSFIAALGYEYYGRLHNPGTWTLKDCGFFNSFQTLSNGNVSYPTLGQLVHEVTYAGPQDNQKRVTLDTSITSIHYVHESCETTWRTDYVSYDWNIQ